MELKIPSDSTNIDINYSLVMTTDVDYVWYNAKSNEIRTFGKDGHLMLTGYAFSVPSIIYLGEL